MTRPVFEIDGETSSLIPDYWSGSGVIWELGAIERATGTRHLWRMEPDLSVADPRALAVGRYYERTAGMLPATPGTVWNLAELPSGVSPAWSDPEAVAAMLAPLLDGAILVAANPAFDAGFLTAFLRYYGQAPTWSYRLRDIGSMARGWLAAMRQEGASVKLPPIDASTDDFARALGVDPEKFERHSALGDCLLVSRMLDVIEGAAP